MSIKGSHRFLGVSVMHLYRTVCAPRKGIRRPWSLTLAQLEALHSMMWRLKQSCEPLAQWKHAPTYRKQLSKRWEIYCFNIFKETSVQSLTTQLNEQRFQWSHMTKNTNQSISPEKSLKNSSNNKEQQLTLQKRVNHILKELSHFNSPVFKHKM